MNLVNRNSIREIASVIDDGIYSSLHFHTDTCPETNGPYRVLKKKSVAHCTECRKPIGTLFE